MITVSKGTYSDQIIRKCECSIKESLSRYNYVLAMVTPICALPSLSDSLRDSESHSNVQCWTLLFVIGVCMVHRGYAGSYCWVATQMRRIIVAFN